MAWVLPKHVCNKEICCLLEVYIRTWIESWSEQIFFKHGRHIVMCNKPPAEIRFRLWCSMSMSTFKNSHGHNKYSTIFEGSKLYMSTIVWVTEFWFIFLGILSSCLLRKAFCVTDSHTCSGLNFSKTVLGIVCVCVC